LHHFVKTPVLTSCARIQHNTGTDNEDGDDEGDSESEEKMLRTQTVDDFLTLLEKPKLPQVLAQVHTHCHTCTVTHMHCHTHAQTHMHMHSLTHSHGLTFIP
jgi:hypothetical protein